MPQMSPISWLFTLTLFLFFLIFFSTFLKFPTWFPTKNIFLTKNSKQIKW